MLLLGRALTLGLLLAATLGGCEGERLPRVDAIVPAAAAPGDTVDLVGEGFAGEDRFVSFAAAEAMASFWQPGRVRVTVPELAPGIILVVVTIDGRPSTPIDFDVTSPDEI